MASKPCLGWTPALWDRLMEETKPATWKLLEYNKHIDRFRWILPGVVSPSPLPPEKTWIPAAKLRSLDLGGESAGFDTGRRLLDEFLGLKEPDEVGEEGGSHIEGSAISYMLDGCEVSWVGAFVGMTGMTRSLGVWNWWSTKNGFSQAWSRIPSEVSYYHLYLYNTGI